MGELLALAEPSRTVVIERGGSGTSWWIPLLVAFAAAAASYYATWRFKRADVNSAHALRAADLVDEAERLVRVGHRYEAEAEGGAIVTLRLLQQAWMRAQPLDDDDLHDRFKSTVYFTQEVAQLRAEPGRARHWLGVAIGDIREGLVSHLRPLNLLRRNVPPQRRFPTFDDLIAMKTEPDGNVLIDQLVDWRQTHSL